MGLILLNQVRRSFVIDVPTQTSSNKVLTQFFFDAIGVLPVTLGYPINVTFNITSASIFYATSTALAGISTGTYVAGSIVTLNNAGKIYGKGGYGGSSGSVNCVLPGDASGGNAGGPGGPAVAMSHALTLNNTGTIGGGGGGGGGGCSHVWGVSVADGTRGGPGGGGQSYSASAKGSTGTRATCTYFSDYSWGSAAANGSVSAGGVGADGETRVAYLGQQGQGGAGGVNGGAGAAGGQWKATSSGLCYYGAGGGGGGGFGAVGGRGGYGPSQGTAPICPNLRDTAGYYDGGAAGYTVDKNGNVLTWQATGTRYGSEGA